MWLLVHLWSTSWAAPPPLDGSYRGPLCVPHPESTHRRPRRVRDVELEKLLATGWLPSVLHTRRHHRHGKLDPGRMFVADDLLLDGTQVRAVLRAFAPSRAATSQHDRAMDRADSASWKVATAWNPHTFGTALQDRSALLREAEARFLEAICRFNRGRAAERSGG